MARNVPVLLTIVGPTAAGKSQVAIALAQNWDTGVVCADSRQFYQEMAIGTDKPSRTQQATVPHYFVDSHSIHEAITAAGFAEQAHELLATLFQKHQVVILVGGSGLYLQALLKGFSDIPAIDPAVRRHWNAYYEEKGLAALAERLREADPRAYALVDTQNPRRVLRALEVKEGTGQSIAAYWQEQSISEHYFRTLKAGIYLPRESLYRKIEQRCDEMLANGLLEEVRSLYAVRHLSPLNSVGYKEFMGYLKGQYDYDEAVRRFKAHSRQLAKRQLTWFRRDPDINWFKPDAIADLKAWVQDRLQTS